MEIPEPPWHSKRILNSKTCPSLWRRTPDFSVQACRSATVFPHLPCSCHAEAKSIAEGDWRQYCAARGRVKRNYPRSVLEPSPGRVDLGPSPMKTYISAGRNDHTPELLSSSGVCGFPNLFFLISVKEALCYTKAGKYASASSNSSPERMIFSHSRRSGQISRSVSKKATRSRTWS